VAVLGTHDILGHDGEREHGQSYCWTQEDNLSNKLSHFGKECKTLATADPTSPSARDALGKNPICRDLNVTIERMQEALRATVDILGIDARQENRHLSIHEVVQFIMNDVLA
jgi:hypothetical protein